MGAYDSYKGVGAPPIVLPMDALRADDDEQRFRLGQLVYDIEGNAYRYIKAAEALTKGRLVTATALAAWDSTIVTDGAITANTTKTIHIDTTTSAMTKNQYAGYYIRQGEAASKGRSFRIKAHDAIAASGEGDIFMEDTIDEAIADGVALLLFHPYLMELTDAATETVRGVCFSPITSGQFGFVQVGGFVQHVFVEGSTGNPTVVNEPIVPIASPAGSGQGRDGTTEADIVEMGLSTLMALDASATDDSFVPAYFLGIV